MTLVSVVVPVYNVEKYIEKAIKSICKQDYENIEIILVDDESKDQSVIKAKDVLIGSNRSFQIIHQKNKGLSGARNTGRQNAHGEYITFIDSDDIIEINHISSLVKICEENKLDVAYANFEYTKEENREGQKTKKGTYEIFTNLEQMERYMNRQPPVHCCSILFRKSFLEKNRYFFNEKLRYGEDLEFMWRVFPNCNRIGCTNQKTYKYLLRNNSIMTTVSEERGRIFIEEFHSCIICNLCIKYPQYENLFRMAYVRNLVGFLKIYARGKNFKEFKIMYDYVKKYNDLKGVDNFTNIKIRIVGNILRLFPRLFWMITRGKLKG